MEQFAPYLGMTLVGLGVIGFVVCVGRSIVWYRSKPGKTDAVSNSDRQ